MNGYTGAILRVDLTKNRITTEPLNAAWACDFIGASGLAARYMFGLVDGTTDPLGPDNPLIWMTGLLTSTRTPSASRSAFCARSPLTGIWGEANVGGFVGAALRDSGYDGVIISGRAETPVYLYINGERAELRDARPFWGLDTFQTQKQIGQALGEPRTPMLCIGPAGENLVRYAAIMTGDARAAGRTGMGAVMGSKRLKAIAVQGRVNPAPINDRERFKAATRRALAHVRDDMAAELLKQMGSASGTAYFDMLGAAPSRYWTQGAFAGIENLNGAVLLETLRVGSGGCWGCWVRCGPEVEITRDGYRLPPVPGPEYETMLSLGSQLLIGDLKPVSYFGHQCDALGLDTISTGAAIGFATYLFDARIIGPQHTGGLELHWGEPETVRQLIHKIACREGLGDLLAEGVRAMEQRFDAAGAAVQINGLDPGMHDPRGISGMALVYLTSPRGACHNKSDFYMIAAGHSFPEIGVESTDPKASQGVAAEVVRHQDWRSFVDSSGCCQFVNAPIPDLVEMVSAATGREETVESLARAGERIFTLKRLLNLRLGLQRDHERLPRLWHEPLDQGGSEGFVPDAELMLAEYYQERDWDIASGRPSAARLAALGLDGLQRRKALRPD
jgi:aldehyde:ferredoxin oxidoreductase